MKIFRPHTVASQALMLPPFQRRLNPWQWCGSQFIWVIFFGKLCNFLEACCLWPAECPALQCPVLWPGPRLLPMLPSWAQPKALEIFRFAHYAFKLGGAMGIGCVSDVFSRGYTCQNRTSGKILPGELMHWKDSLLLWWGKVLIFALLEFCFLVSCAGFNLDSIEGEKLPTFAKTLKTGAIRDPRWCSLITTMATLLFWGDDITLGSSKLPVKLLGWNLHQREQMSPWELWGSGKWEQSTRRVLLGFAWIWCQCQWCQWCSCWNVTM